MIEYPPVRISKADVTYFNEVDDVVGRSITAGDPMIAFEYVQGLQREGFLKGLAIAKLMYRMQQAWDLFRVSGTDDDFENVVEATLGYQPSTQRKYINMWQSVFENQGIPEETRLLLMGQPIETLLLLTAAAREGSLDESDWEIIAHAPDKKTVRDKIRDRRGEQTSSSSARPMSIYFRDTAGRAKGTVIVTVGGQQKIVGFLKIDDEDDDVRQSVEKIINKFNMYEIY